MRLETEMENVVHILAIEPGISRSTQDVLTLYYRDGDNVNQPLVRLFFMEKHADFHRQYAEEGRRIPKAMMPLLQYLSENKWSNNLKQVY